MPNLMYRITFSPDGSPKLCAVVITRAMVRVWATMYINSQRYVRHVKCDSTAAIRNIMGFLLKKKTV